MKMQLRSTKRTDTENFYITNQMLVDQWRLWIQSGDKPETRTIPDQLAIYIRDIAQRLTGAQCFVRYSQELKEDMVSEGILKCFKNLKNLKASRQDSYFNYLTRCCYCAFYQVLKKHYRHLNLVKELTIRAIDEIKSEMGCTEQILRLERSIGDQDDVD